MKNTILVGILFIFLIGCESPYVFNRIVTKKDGDKMLLGGVSKEAFLKAPFSEWYVTEYEKYQPNSEKIKEIKSKLNKYTVEVFIGTWCEDCRTHYPHFIKILDEAKFSEKRLVTYAVNESKKSFYSEEMGKDIRFLPTFIFYKNGKEVGRIVESPVSESLEEDILHIVSENPLIPNHSRD